MSQDSGVLPALRSLAIVTAFAFGFYFLLVWNPVGTLADVRNYFEHRVRVPVEWIALVFPVAWLIQRNHGCAVAAAVFVPISILILTLTKPDYGAEFWRIFRNEVYLDPIYVRRGLLVCFFLLSLGVFTRILVTKRGDAWDGDRQLTFALCLIIGFAVTSWEALITPSAPPRFESGGWIVGWWTAPIYAVWRIIDLSISQYFPPDYQNAVRIGVSVYPFLAAFLLLSPSYRQVPKDFVRDLREELPVYLVLGVLVALSGWAFWAATRGGSLGGGAKFVLAILSIPAVLALIALVLTSIIWIPAVLFFLPAFLFWVVAQPFKVIYFLVVKVPFMVLHYLHYLMVPHPVEEVIKQYEAVRTRDATIDYASFAKKMARRRYNWVREGLPAWWKSKNWEKRLKDVDALRGRVRAEKDVAEKYTEEFRKDHREDRG